MQKKIIALAVAALASSAAMAQSNVTVYGVADAYVGSFKTDGAHRQTVVNSGGLAASRIGFKGTEDLGNGLKAIFALEYRIEIDNNNGVGFTTSTASSGPARQQLVGLTGGFGTAVAGRLQTTGYDWAVSYDTLAGTAISPLQNVNATAQIAGIAGNTGAIIGGTTYGARANNAIAYVSPSFSGLTLAYNHAELGEQTVAVAKNNIAADLLSANYANGPLAIGLVYAHGKDNSAAAGVANKQSDWGLGGSYNLGVAKLSATYQRTRTDGNGFVAAAGNSTAADSAWSLGVAVPVTAAGTVMASYAKNNVKHTGANDNVNAYTVAYAHALSKRTTAYAGYAVTNRADGINVAVAGTAGVAGADTKQLVGGIKHSF